MTNEELFEVLGDIDDVYILEPTQTVKKSVNFKALAALAACFCVVTAAAVFARLFFFHPKGMRLGLPLYTADEVVRGGEPTNGYDEGHGDKPLANITREEALTDFGGLFPSEIIDGYELTSMGYQVAGTVDDLRLLHVIYYNKDNGETLMIEVSKKGRYHGSELNTVIVGDGHNFNGSEIYIDGGDYVIFYHMNKSNISEVDGFVEMVESSEYFSTRGVPLIFKGSEHDEIVILMDSIHLNEIDSIYSAAMKYYDPEEYIFRDMTDGEVAEHYGRDPVPAYIPEGMSVERSQKFVISNSGEVCEDGVHIILSYNVPAENGQPQGITVSAAKVGVLTDALYILPENETRISNICGVDVAFGCRQMSYGPYENPRGYYDLYEADFEIGDIRYQVVAKQISLEETLKVVASVIAETDNITVTD